MPSDDRRKLGHIQLVRVRVPAPVKTDDSPPSSTVRSVPDGAAPASSADASGVDLSRVVLGASLLELVPRAAAEALQVLPLSADDARIVVAMANPRDAHAVDEIGFTCGRAVSVRPADPRALAATIRAAYDALESGAPEYRADRSR